MQVRISSEANLSLQEIYYPFHDQNSILVKTREEANAEEISPPFTSDL